MSTMAGVVTDTFTSAGSATASATVTSSPQATQVTHAPSVFSSSSLLFGLIFMAVLIVFMIIGFAWQRIVLGRHRTFMSLVERIQEIEILQSKPKIWDAHVRLREEGGCFKDFKPLSAQLLPRSSHRISNPPNFGQSQVQSDATPTSPHPSVLRRIIDWLDPRPFYNPLLPSPPPNILIPSSLTPTRKGKAGVKGKGRGTMRKARIADRSLSVSVVIAMPTPRRGKAAAPLSQFAPQSLVSSSPSIAEEPQELFYELGVAHVPLRFQSSHPSQTTTRDEKDNGVDDDDYETFLDELFNDGHDHDHVNKYRGKDNVVTVDVNTVRVSG